MVQPNLPLQPTPIPLVHVPDDEPPPAPAAVLPLRTTIDALLHVRRFHLAELLRAFGVVDTAEDEEGFVGAAGGGGGHGVAGTVGGWACYWGRGGRGGGCEGG